MTTDLSVELDVRVSDLGPSGHLSNVASMRLLDEARSRLFGVNLPALGLNEGGLLDVLDGRARMVIGRHLVEFRREVWHPVTSLTIRMWIPTLGRSSLALAAAVYEDGIAEPAVVAQSQAVLVASDTGRPWPMDTTARELFGRYCGPRPVFRDLGAADPRTGDHAGQDL
ncbi:acyl-CoA thioesterase [Streptomyces sp. NPDC005963]|uniref:acyl-CoA thioesterase n=1 Tax=Streptomyces sp. NPDC005963 TaxID=3156721 RepID=UPI0033E164C7